LFPVGVRIIVSRRRVGFLCCVPRNAPHRVGQGAIPALCAPAFLLDEYLRSRFGRALMRSKPLLAAAAGSATLGVITVVIAVFDLAAWQTSSINGAVSLGADGPTAGAGLPFLLAAGGYFWVRRRRDRNKGG
jgi:hypothetical protein